KLLQNVVKGDVDKGFAEADEIIEGTGFYECFPNPLPPEPPGVVAYWENPDKLVAYVATQSLGLNKYLAQPFFRMANTQHAIYRHTVRRQLRHEKCQPDANRLCR
ncbi:MAG: molybdopterin cofactor-binding domain-containing protein, partial [Thermodesulfobacteriota bacterium]